MLVKVDELSEGEVTPRMIAGLVAGIGPFAAMALGVADIDRDAGWARLGPHTVCCWRTDGRRITLDASDCVIAGVSEEPDPDYPGQRFTISVIGEEN